jgi:hypothetical protein
LSDEAQTLRVAATETVTAALPEMNIRGSEDDLVGAWDPGTLSGPVSPDRLRQWLTERNESAYQREQLAGRSLGQAEVDEDLADSYTQMAGEAGARAATERAGIETDRALVERLTVRKAEAEALEKRLFDQVKQESVHQDRLREAGDAAGAEAAGELVTGLLRRQFQWSGQASSLEDRIEAKQASIQQSEEEAVDYDQLATEFRNLAERHDGLADFGEKVGAELHDEIDSDDFLTDHVESALASSDETGLDMGFHLIDGRSGTELDIEMERDAEPVDTVPTSGDDVESASGKVEPVDLVSPGGGTPPPEEVVAPETSAVGAASDALIAEALARAEFDAIPAADAIPEADVDVASFEPIEVASFGVDPVDVDPVHVDPVDVDPVDDEFAQQIDVAEQIEDSFEGLLDE